MQRKRSLIRPERSRIEPGHRHYNYAQKAAEHAGRIDVLPSSTGNDPVAAQEAGTMPTSSSFNHGIPLNDMGQPLQNYDTIDEHPEYDPKGGRNVYGLNDEVGHLHEQGYDKAAETEYGPQNMADPLAAGANAPLNGSEKIKAPKEDKLSLWHAYCKFVTCLVPGTVLKWFGMKDKDRQMAWREKIGLITVIMYAMAFVAYLTFGFTQTVCKNSVPRARNNEVSDGNMIINGYYYDLTKASHPAAQGIDSGSPILYPPMNGAGMDGSFMFQNVNGHCKGLFTAKENCKIPHDGENFAYYFPCRMFAQNGTTQANFSTEHYEGYACHTSSAARKAYYDLDIAGEVYFTWDDVKNSTRNLVVFNGNVIDLALVDWIRKDDLNYPEEFDWLRNNDTIRGMDVSQYMSSGRDAKIMNCLSETMKVGVVDTMAVGCIASQVVLYVSLVFIVGLVAVKFLFACYFNWVMARRQGAFYMDNKQLNEHSRQIEDWSDNIYSQGPISAPAKPPRRQSKFFGGRSGKGAKAERGNNVTMSSQLPMSSVSKLAPGGALYNNGNGSRGSLMMLNSTINEPSMMSADTSYRSPAAQLDDQGSYYHGEDSYVDSPAISGVGSGSDMVPGMADYLIPQPPPDYRPFGFPLAHTVCLVTAYSESVEGLRTTLDSIATTDYPNSHKLIMIVCDGLVKGSGNDMTTPEIALSMMKDFVERPEDVQPHSYVSVVSGSKRHNMAKVYAGFYKYDDSTVEVSKQQRVPILVISKCGTPAEANAAKPGNRGKRDSQVILMTFFQRVMFDERMTELEYEIFNSIFKVTGIAPDFYEIMLMVDADTKVFPDSLTHMVAEMVKDPEIMGLCGETKIANKTESWVTGIQVFEYFISHHQTKAFESVFGGVTCLPGCFCMYRIKTPKGPNGYWVPILANPDIVEHYSDNVVDTLHKKNLLLLGEDRFLTTLMLRTFPKRKQVFVPKAACKTIAPSEFKVLLSQRRRWINSTVHNLFELILVNDLCGVFCISMQFVVFVDLISTLVLPAAITFTLYVIIIAIVSTPTPTMSLILLALILGLPGCLIVVTASKASYVLWMGAYLLALPVWNFILPMYAYWKFDDFSWGETRAIAGGDKGGHDAAEGEFDSSQIVMKRWREFERERRRVTMPPYAVWGGGTPSMVSSTTNQMTGPTGISGPSESGSSTEEPKTENDTML